MLRRITFLCAVFSFTIAAGGEGLDLPPPDLSHGTTLMQALSDRRSTRVFDRGRPLPLPLLSDLLWSAFGVNRDDGRRTAPSARNRQEIDLYVALPDALYRYDPSDHRLVREQPGDIRHVIYSRPFAADAPCSLILVADFDRMADAGDEHRRFYSAANAGYISQNIYLFCAARGLNTVVLGMVNRAGLAEAMLLRPSQHVLLAHPVGFAPEVPAETPTDPPRSLRDGLFRCSAEGYAGPIEVEIRVDGGRLTALKIIRQQETVPVRAFQGLPERIIAAQGTTGIDAVTGATVTSRAIFEAAENALEQSRARP